VLQEDSGLSWDNTNKRLNLVSSGDNLLNLTPQASGNAIVFNNNSYIKWGSVGYMRGFSTATTFAVYNAAFTNIFNIGTTAACYVNTGSNFLIGTTTDAGFKLDVNGTARVKGASNVGTTTAFTITNSDSINTLQVQDNGYIRIGSQGTSAFRIYATDTSGDSEPSGLHLVLNSRVVSSATPAGIGMVMINGINGTATTGTQNVFLISKGFAPTSGTATYATTSIIPTINQTGGANGITRGLYVNPTLTAAADFRAIEVASGTTVLAPSVTARASLRIPSGTAPTSPVNGDIWFDGTDIKMRIGGVTKTFTLI
jgi:hypothetical protein